MPSCPRRALSPATFLPRENSLARSAAHSRFLVNAPPTRSSSGHPHPPAPLPAAAAVDGGSSAENRWLFWIAGLLISVHLGLGLLTAAAKTPTHDEYWHLPVGLLNLTHRRFNFDLLNPPLARMWFALPLWVSGVAATPGPNPDETGRQFHAEHVENYRTLFFFGRAGNVLLSCGLAFLLFRCARSLFGLPAAVGTLLLYIGCPNILAHSAVATMDLPVALGMAGTTWALWRWMEVPSWKRAALWGLVLGLSLAAKYTALMMLPFPFLAAAVLLWRPGKRLRVLGELAAGLVLMVVALDGCYLFQSVGMPLKTLPLQSAAMKSVQLLLSPLENCPVPIARDYVMGVDLQQLMLEHDHPVFLNGRWMLQGDRRYFLDALVYKLPHVLQIALLLGGITLVRAGRPIRWTMLWVFLPAVVLVAIASFQKAQLGVRYILPAFPAIFLCAGHALSGLSRLSLRGRGIAMACLAIACGTSLRHHPHHLAYFNELAGGPVGGRMHLLDSNLDWGQDLHLVKNWMNTHHETKIHLAYFGMVDPHKLGIDYDIPEGELAPGWYAISVNLVQGRPSGLLRPDETTLAVGPGAFRIFHFLQPAERLGYSIDLYHVTDEELERLRH